MKIVTNNRVGGFRSKLKLWKSMAAGCGLLLILPGAWAQFTWPVYEPFGEYANGTGLGTELSTNFWNFGNGGAHAYWAVTNTAAMSWPGLVGDPNAEPKGVQEIPENTTSADRGCMFTPRSATFYASFLLNYQDNGNAITNRAIFNVVNNATAYSSDTHIYSSVWLTPDYRIEIDKNAYGGGAFSDATRVLATNVPHLIVLRYLVVPGGSDEMDLWVDPPGLGNDGYMPPPDLSTTNGPNLTGFNGFMLDQRNVFGAGYQQNLFQIDEIRLGDTWSSVTPSTPVPGPLFGVTGGGTGCAGDSFHVGVSGSVTTNDYLLYTNGVYNGQSLTGTGSAVDFGAQTAKGTYTVLASNTITADVAWMTNSVFVKITQPPTIVGEPQPAVTTTNNRAEFQVTVTGSGVSYQWYRDNVALTNDSHLTGATANGLVISPATTADVGNYYCIITNTCGDVVTTSTNSLTLDAPNDLVWSGDSFSLNVWAVGITAVPEFNSGSVFFNQGDNVTFDNSYNGAQYGSTITLSNVLAPTLVTYGTSQTLTWAGPGYIGGSASLLVNGAGGVLNLDNNPSSGYANTYTGGTVISSGTVNMHYSWSGLGTGPVTLAGGTLETYQKGDGTGKGLSNPLLVTADSTWQVDRTGDQCAGTLAGLLGNPGTTLSLTNSATTVNKINRVRFGGSFTNDSAIAVSVNTQATNSELDVAAYTGWSSPSSIVQVYNGPISGDTAFMVEGFGAAYLNGANTFTNNTTVDFGFLGGSGSINGNLVVEYAGTLEGGSQNAIGTFTVNGNVLLNDANVLVRVDKALTQSNDKISVSGSITNAAAGTVTITNIGTTPLVAGDKFQVFSGPVQNGNALTVTGGGMAWINNLAVDGSVQVSPVITASPTITGFSVQGSNVVISGINGQAATAYLLMATNIAEPLNQWKTVATNVLGGNAFTFTGTNVVTAGSPQQFFILSSTNYNP